MSSNRKLRIYVKTQNGEEMLLQMRPDVKIADLIAKVCKRINQDPQSVHFIYNNRKLNPKQTPSELGMQNDDVIEVTVNQVGGWNERHCGQ